MAGTPVFQAYYNALARVGSKYYRKLGIKMEFKNFEEWFAELGPRPSSELSVDRIDGLGNYAKGNVRWATRDVQIRNQRGKWYVEQQFIEFGDDDYPWKFFRPHELPMRTVATFLCPEWRPRGVTPQGENATAQ